MNVKFSRRIKAWYIDWAFFIPFSILELLIAYLVVYVFNNDGVLFWIDEHFDAFFIFDVFLYFFVCDLFTKNGSIGKKIMKIKIVNEHDGKRPPKWKLFIRGIVDFFDGIDILFCAKRIDRRSFGDLVCKTRVVYATIEEQIKHEDINVDEWQWSSEENKWDDSEFNK